MMTTSLFSCASTVYTAVKLPLPEPLEIIRFNQGDLNCLNPKLKILIVRRLSLSELRIIQLRNIIKSTH